MALRKLSHLDFRVYEFGIVCSVCRGTGGLDVPKTYKEVWGKSLINGRMVCMYCQGTGVIGGIPE